MKMNELNLVRKKRLKRFGKRTFLIMALLMCFGAGDAWAQTYTVTISVNPAGAAKTTSGAGKYWGGTVTVSATANTGYTFSHWTWGNNGSSTNNPYSWTIAWSRDFVANFTKNEYTLTVNKSPSAGGTVTGGGTYVWGTSRTVTATAHSGYRFSCWTDQNHNVVSRNASYTFNMPTSDYTLTANFISADTWNEDLISGAKYTVTTVTENEVKRFKVTCDNTNSINHNQTFLYVGNVTASSGTVTINFNNSKPLKVKGNIKVEKGTLNMKLGDNYTSSTTLERGSGFKGMLIYVSPTGSCNLNIDGKSGKNFCISGGASMTVTCDKTKDASTWKATISDANYNSYYGLIYLKGGTTNLNYVTLTNSYVGTLEYNGNNYTCSGGGIIASLNDNYNIGLTMNYCIIDSCYARGNGSALYASSAATCEKMATVKMYNCTIQNCFNGTEESFNGGTIRCPGSAKAQLTMDGCTVKNNVSKSMGGGVTWITGLVNNAYSIINCTIENNVCGATGAGLRLSGSGEVKSCTIKGNYTKTRGGGIHYGTYASTEEASPSFNNVKFVNGSLNLDASTSITNNTAEGDGGGVYFNVSPINIKVSDNSYYTVFKNTDNGQYEVSLTIDGTTITGNKAKNGGGFYINRTTDIYIANSNFIRGTLSDNQAEGFGGGTAINTSNTATFYGNSPYEPSEMQIEFGNTDDGNGQLKVRKNKAGQRGGACYVSGTSTVNIYSGTFGGSDDTYTYANEVANGNGGAFFVNNGNVTIKKAEVSYNKASEGLGGGVYVSGGSITIDGASILCNGANSGAGFYAQGGSVTIQNNSKVNNNTASENGGGFYCAGGSLTVSGTSTEINNNEASGNGGGFFVDGGNFNLTGGTIGSSGEGNQAVNGGGFYIQGGNSTISSGTIQYNTATYGGGVYIDENATINMSDGSVTDNTATGNGGGIYQGGTFNVSGSSLQVTGNLLKGTAKDTGVPNNIYLPSTSKYITIVDPGLSGSAEVGITIPDFPAPVIYSATRTNLQTQYQAFQSGTSQLKDDSNICQVLYSDAAPYDLDHIYFIGTWQGYVHSLGIDPSSYTDESFSTIDSPEKLAIYMSYVNGVNGFAKHPEANGTMSADVDMSEYLWIPIGTRCTSGTEGAETDPYTGTFDGKGYVIRGLNVNGLVGYANYGLFGDVAGGTVKDVFLTDCDFSSYGECTMGTLVGQMNGGTVMNAEGAGKLGVSNSNSTLGGLVGAMTNGARIVNGMAMCDMTGTKMGGLAGTVASESSIVNSFSNAKLTYSGTAGSHTGGIAADNAGTVTNCYSRLREGSATGSSYGSLVGNNSGTVSNSYAQTSKYIDINSGNADSGLGTYGPTVTPYGYGQAEDGDNKVGDTPLCDKLNGNLAEGYAQWMRTSASPINGDYPILKLGYESVASADGIVLEYGSLDQSFLRHDTGTALLYGAASVSEAQPSGMTLYIDEDAVMTQSAPGAISAYVGVTFDNSANPEESGTPYDWHMFSTPLADAPLGISYTDSNVAPYGTDPAQYGFTAGGYFPTNTPYANFDYYCFDEPSYHWINFKRNSASHWHSDGEHANITYSNEDELIPGKGYLMAIAEETYLQSHGTLNDGEVKRAVTTSGVNLTGYNLLGNPYQSYLDFDAFADKNASLWDEGSGNANSYLILDSDKGAYITYVKGGSEGGEYASRYLHPHQGFFVRVDNAGEAAFGNDMRSISVAGGEPYFRGEEAKVNYPLVNLYAADESGKRDILVVELERPEQSGAEKMSGIRNAECQVYSSSDGTDYSVLFAKGHVTEVPVRFEAFSDGEFTFTWNTQNGDFSYLHLIDNLAGTDCDCLSADSYTFTASTEDYRSRFKLKLEYKSEMPAAEESAESFAYQTGDELVVNGTGYVQIVDMLGRVLYETRLTDTENRIAVPSDAKDLYMVRLSDSEGVKVQKMVIK